MRWVTTFFLKNICCCRKLIIQVKARIKTAEVSCINNLIVCLIGRVLVNFNIC